MSESPEKACVNCHFLTRVRAPGEQAPKELVFSVSQESRDRLREGNFDWYSSPEYLKCHKGVWDEGVGLNRDESEWQEELVKRDREGECFFWPRTEGMMMEAAEELQEREADRRQFQDRNFWVMVAAMAAALSVVVDLLARFGLFRWLLQLLSGQ